MDGHNHTALGAALTSGCSLKKPNLVFVGQLKGKVLALWKIKLVAL